MQLYIYFFLRAELILLLKVIIIYWVYNAAFVFVTLKYNVRYNIIRSSLAPFVYTNKTKHGQTGPTWTDKNETEQYSSTLIAFSCLERFMIFSPEYSPRC